jgi:mannose/fructose/N-acetylgalactosamine-specific phosphotransferase system component IID
VASEGKRITRMDLFGVFWRSFFLQTSWSFDRMQSLGFAFAMMPVLRRLYPDRTERSARLQDQMEYFNTQPYFANFVLGAAARAEEERASGVVPAPDPGDIKRTLMAPLGALGDSFFWGALKPLAAAVAVATLLGGAWWAPLLYLGLYNVVHIGMRGVLLAEGYRTGGDVVALLSRYNFTRMARLLKVLSLAGIGCIVGTITAWGPEFQAIEPPLYGLLLACAALAAVIGLSFLLRSGLSPVQLMLGLAALSLGLAWGGII